MRHAPASIIFLDFILEKVCINEIKSWNFECDILFVFLRVCFTNLGGFINKMRVNYKFQCFQHSLQIGANLRNRISLTRNHYQIYPFTESRFCSNKVLNSNHNFFSIRIGRIVFSLQYFIQLVPIKTLQSLHAKFRIVNKVSKQIWDCTIKTRD